MLKCFSLRLSLQFRSLILFAYQKYTLVLVLPLMIANFIQTTPLAIKEVVFVVIENAFLPLRTLDSQYCKKAFVLNLKLVTKLLTLYLSTNFQAKVKMTLKFSVKTLN